MHTLINPVELAPAASYSHGVLVSGEVRWLAIAGQVGRDLHGDIPDGEPSPSGMFSTKGGAGMAAVTDEVQVVRFVTEVPAVCPIFLAVFGLLL